MRELQKQTHEREADCNIYKGCHQKELPSKFCIINGEEDVIQGGQEQDGLMLEDGTD
jgi:hypothetical protein